LVTVDLILPLYNPKKEWETDIIRQLDVFYDKVEDYFDIRLILVNDGSTIPITNEAAAILKKFHNSLIVEYQQNKGKGHALRAGVEASTGDIILYTDHDIPYTYGSMIEMLNLLHNDIPEVVIGHRDENYYKDLPWIRVKISHYLKTINRFILGLNTDDTQCGLKGFRKSVRHIFLETKTNRFLIDIEFLKRLKKASVKVQVIDVKSRENVIMSTLGISTIISELYSYAKIVLTNPLREPGT